MFEITIKGETLDALWDNLAAIYGGVAQPVANQRSYEADDAAREKMQAKRKAKENPGPKSQPDWDPEEDETAPPEPMPEGAGAVVDAGTGKVVEKPLNKPADEPVKQMTLDDVKAAASKLVAKDVTALTAILKKYDATKLSEVPKGKLGDFAGDVMEALETA